MGMYEKHYLKHWGIKGMRWGVRRYQNEDGSLTALGERRYNRDADEKGYDGVNEVVGRYKTDKHGNKEALAVDARRYVQEDMQIEKEGLDSARQLAGHLKNATDASIRNARNNRPQMDLSNMSEKEMRDAINRALLERQYNDMFAPQQSTKGRETVSQVLETAGTVLAVGSSALGIALAIGKLTGKVS